MDKFIFYKKKPLDKGRILTEDELYQINPTVFPKKKTAKLPDSSFQRTPSLEQLKEKPNKTDSKSVAIAKGTKKSWSEAAIKGQAGSELSQDDINNIKVEALLDTIEPRAKKLKKIPYFHR